MDNRYECLILGGGVIGLSLAWELADRGLKVALVDRGEFGQEASWAGAGILPPANRDTAQHPLDQLRALSYDLHLRWAQTLQAETGIDNGYRRCGGVYLARSRGEAAALRGMMNVWREEGVRAELLDAKQLSEIEPELAETAGRNGLLACYWLADEAQLRNPRHIKALIAGCTQRGVAMLSHIEVREFQTRAEQIVGVLTSDRLLQAERYCVCSGAWTHRLLLMLNAKTGILPIRGQMVLFNCGGQRLRRIVNEGSRYLVPRDDGHVLAGSTEEEVGFCKETTPESIAELTRFARTTVPSLQGAPIVRTWSGLRPGTFDGFPYLGAIPGMKNGFVAAGHFRSGLYLSTGTAVVMSQLIFGEEPEIDLEPFSVLRG